jgi:hypothetical protein
LRKVKINTISIFHVEEGRALLMASFNSLKMFLKNYQNLASVTDTMPGYKI